MLLRLKDIAKTYINTNRIVYMVTPKDGDTSLLVSFDGKEISPIRYEDSFSRKASDIIYSDIIDIERAMNDNK